MLKQSQYYFNPLSPSGERLGVLAGPINELTISTHSPHPGRDASSRCWTRWSSYFNPLSPSGERRFICNIRCSISKFQPTLPIRGETFSSDLGRHKSLISTHSPHPGRDSLKLDKPLQTIRFQPTLPIRGETTFQVAAVFAYIISTHSPHPGRDITWSIELETSDRFQPTLPIRGETIMK